MAGADEGVEDHLDDAAEFTQAEFTQAGEQHQRHLLEVAVGIGVALRRAAQATDKSAMMVEQVEPLRWAQ